MQREVFFYTDAHAKTHRARTQGHARCGVSGCGWGWRRPPPRVPPRFRKRPPELVFVGEVVVAIELVVGELAGCDKRGRRAVSRGRAHVGAAPTRRRGGGAGKRGAAHARRACEVVSVIWGRCVVRPRTRRVVHVRVLSLLHGAARVGARASAPPPPVIKATARGAALPQAVFDVRAQLAAVFRACRHGVCRWLGAEAAKHPFLRDLGWFASRLCGGASRVVHVK